LTKRLNKKIVLITSGQPSLNPRLVKEADSLAENGYDVMVIYQYWNDWGTKMDEGLLVGKRWEAIRVGGSTNENPVAYWLSKNLYRARQAINKLFGGRFLPAELLIGRCTQLLAKEASRHLADLYIAHNLAALPAAVKAAKKYNTKSGFDAEDFHRNEVSDDPNNPNVILKSTIEDKYLPKVNYVTASSPGIGAAYKRLFHGTSPVVLLNAFPVDTTIKFNNTTSGGTLRLFWFSQTIGPQRGIEDIVTALTILDNREIELHLLGFLPSTGKEYLERIGADKITLQIYPPMPPDAINQFAFQFDIGLALETGFCLNNDLALSNKIFTYMQAGLAVIASDTTAQKSLLDEYPKIGGLYKKGDATMLANLIRHYFINRAELWHAKKESHAVACEQLNWEKESGKFLSLIKEVVPA